MAFTASSNRFPELNTDNLHTDFGRALKLFVYEYPINWRDSLGHYRTWSFFNGTRASNPTNTFSYSGTVKYHVEDFYNFSQSTENLAYIFTGVDVFFYELWDLHYYGYAQSYAISSYADISVSWMKGQRIGTGAVLSY